GDPASGEFGDVLVERTPLPPSVDLCYPAERCRFVKPQQEFKMASAKIGTLNCISVVSAIQTSAILAPCTLMAATAF
ncbi:hypothetical protein AVEN_8196-1, partial [Araneus ventricosus]